jgi:ankyrin repeat protein
MTSNLLAALTAHRTSKTASNAPTHPLHEAAQTGNVDALIKALEEPKIKVDQKDPQGLSALMVAAEKGNMEIAKYLVERGARVAAKDDNGETAVMKAAVKGYADLCLFLIHAQCAQRKTTKELGVDSSAALANEKKRIVEAKDDEGITALMKVAAVGSLDLFKLLLEQKASPEAKDDYGWTPMFWAALEGKLNILEYCVNDLMLVVDQANEKGETLLQKAATNGYTDVCRFLIAQGAKLNSSDQDQQTPLMWAAGAGHLDTVVYLLSCDAKPGESRSGKSALHFAAQFGHVEIADVLTDHGWQLAKQDEGGATPLHCAVQGGFVEMSMMLLEKKIAIDKVNKRGMTALAVAAENQQYECCKLLINNGANLYVQDENGQLASDTAEGTLNARVVELFRQAMIDNPRKEDE